MYAHYTKQNITNRSKIGTTAVKELLLVGPTTPFPPLYWHLALTLH